MYSKPASLCFGLPVVVPVLHREEAEHSSRLHGSLDILNELVGVVSLVLQSLSCNDRRLAVVPPSAAADSEDATTRQAVTNNSEGVGQVGSTRLVQDQTRLKPHEHERQRDVEQKRKQECQPPTNVVCSVRCGGRHESSDVDEEVEPKHDSLSAVLGVLNDTLSALEGDDFRHVRLHLIKQKWSDVWLEHRCTNSKDVDTNEEGDLCGVVLDESLRTTSDDKDVTNTAKDDSPEDHGVATKAGVGKVSNDQRQTVGNQTERLAGSVGDLFAETQGTLGGLATCGYGTPAVSTLGQGTVDVVRPDLSAALNAC
jgi:hypothetical protein